MNQIFRFLETWFGTFKAVSLTSKPNFKNGFQINGVDFDGDESGYLSGITPGTVAASKAVVVDSNKDVGSIITLRIGEPGDPGTVRVYSDTGGYFSIVADNTALNDCVWAVASQAAGTRITTPSAGGSANVALDKAFACLTAAGAALLPSSASEAIITGGTKVISAGAITAGNVIRFRAAVKVNAINATDTLTVRARIGATTASLSGTVVASHISGATTAANDVVVLDGYIDARSFATPNMTFDAMGIGLGLLAGVGGISTPTVATAFTINSTAAIDLSITIEFSTNSGTNSATLQGFTHEIKAS